MSSIAQEHWTEQLAAFLCSGQARIIDAWMAAVAADPEIVTADSITRQQLLDHLPQMFDDLADALVGRGQGDAPPTENAEKHGHHRWEQGYLLPELLRELARVRYVMLDQLVQFQDEHPDFRGAERLIALQRLHFFFDQMVARSTEQFVSEQQAELRALNDHLRAVDDSRLRLLRSGTHDLRNAVNASHLTTQEMAEEEDHAARNEMLVTLRRNLEHMTRLVGDLLTYSTLFDAAHSPRFVPLRVSELVEELEGHFRPQAEAKGLAFIAASNPAIDFVTSDPTKLRQITHNLISNALKYTERGEVQLFIQSVGVDRWMIVVQDTGLGIGPAEREHLFSEYFRAPQTAHLEGSGLGLAIVKRLVELLHGEIQLHSEPGQGARFEVILPRVLS